MINEFSFRIRDVNTLIEKQLGEDRPGNGVFDKMIGKSPFLVMQCEE